MSDIWRTQLSYTETELKMEIYLYIQHYTTKHFEKFLQVTWTVIVTESKAKLLYINNLQTLQNNYKYNIYINIVLGQWNASGNTSQNEID